jgi:hypothetical protein
MTTTTPIATGEISNTCTCVMIDENGERTEEYTSYCYGDCWENSVDEFVVATDHLRDANETGWWKVENLRLWDGEVSGMFHAKNTDDKVEDILRGMAVRGEWTMRYEVFTDRIEYSLSHHDAPTGSSSVLRCVSETEREEWGLY